MSTCGMQMQSLVPFAVGSRLMISANELVVGELWVRYCEWHGCTYKLGLEFLYPISSRF